MGPFKDKSVSNKLGHQCRVVNTQLHSPWSWLYCCMHLEAGIKNVSEICGCACVILKVVFITANSRSAARHCYQPTVHSWQSHLRYYTLCRLLIKPSHTKGSHVSPRSLNLSKALLTTKVLSRSNSQCFSTGAESRQKQHDSKTRIHKMSAAFASNVQWYWRPLGQWACALHEQ